MRSSATCLAIAGIVLTGTLEARGQVTFEGCQDIRGVPVASIARPGLGDVAKSVHGPQGEPVILYDHWILSWFSPQTRLFWYGHECGHHALGHGFGLSHPLSLEQEADCFGVNAILEEGIISRDEVHIIQNDLARLGPGDWTHLPGPQRAVNLQHCIGGNTAGSNSCEFARDGECDEPDVCEPGTDASDCDSRLSRGRRRTVGAPPPIPPPATACMSRAGPCPMVEAVPRGAPCTCFTPFGPAPGVAN